MRDDKKQNIFYIAMNLISITHILTHILHLQKHKQNKAKCCTNFRFSIYDLGVKMGDDKNTKTYFYISINFISITNVQTTSKTWAKTRGNAAQFWILSFFVLDVKFRRPKIQNDKKQTLSIWFQLENTNCILDIKIISKNKGKCCCFFNFAILAS